MAIDRKTIIDQMSQIEMLPDENGIIEGCNVLVNQLPAKLWNTSSTTITSP